MQYAKVVFGLPVEGPFDYSVLPALPPKLKPPARVLVEFRNQKKIGFIVGFSPKSPITKVKPVIKILDNQPILNRRLFLLARKLSAYYCCSLGEAVETAIPLPLRRLRKAVDFPAWKRNDTSAEQTEKILLHDLNSDFRWHYYIKKIAEALKKRKSTVIIMSDLFLAKSFQNYLKANSGIEAMVLSRSHSGALKEWLAVASGGAKVVIGSRSAIFAPLSNLGLIIIDGEEDPVYKQEQSPHYHARTLALMRSQIESASLILGSMSPSLASWRLAKENKIRYVQLARQRKYPEIKIVPSRGSIFSQYLMDSISSALSAKEKILLFINRRGFATLALCNNCSKVLKCLRCSANLIYHFGSQKLSCHHCGFSIEPPKICPFCNSGYVVYSGFGCEKIESEISRIFPTAKVNRIDVRTEADFSTADIFVSTSIITKLPRVQFGLIGVLAIDNELNRPELGAAEKAFGILSKLSCLTEERMVIQSSLSFHHSLQAVLKDKPELFYEEELKERRELGLPPFTHFAVIKLRGSDEEKAERGACDFYAILNSKAKNKIKIITLKKGVPYKLRGKFYWNIFLSCPWVRRLNVFLKSHLKYFNRSGIIVTVDVDPL